MNSARSVPFAAEYVRRSPQGQWLGNEKAAVALRAVKLDGPVSIRIPQGLRPASIFGATAIRASSCQRGLMADIGLYEQGIERSITLEPVDGRWQVPDGKYEATYRMRTGWRPNPAVEEIPREKLEKILLTAREAFMSAALAGGALAKHPWTKEWLKGFPEQG